jgi:hypothetical protein
MDDKTKELRNKLATRLEKALVTLYSNKTLQKMPLNIANRAFKKGFDTGYNVGIAANQAALSKTNAQIERLKEAIKWIRREIAFDRKEDVVVAKCDESLASLETREEK